MAEAYKAFEVQTPEATVLQQPAALTARPPASLRPFLRAAIAKSSLLELSVFGSQPPIYRPYPKCY